MLYTETVDIKVNINALYGQRAELLAFNLAVYIITTTL